MGYNKTLNHLILFISEYVKVEPEDITLQTRLESDLSLYGDEAVEFLISYSKNFDVDVNEFPVDEYFSSEGVSLLRPLFQIFGWNKKTKELLVNDLYEGILKKKL